VPARRQNGVVGRRGEAPPVDPTAGVAEGIGNERVARVLVEDDDLAVAMDLLAAANREDSLDERLGRQWRDAQRTSEAIQAS
jgi:hypothetical protein